MNSRDSSRSHSSRARSVEQPARRTTKEARPRGCQLSSNFKKGTKADSVIVVDDFKADRVSSKT